MAESLINQRVMKVYKSKSGNTTFRKKRIGDLVAMKINDRVVYGWSLCHRKDTYDFIDGEHQKGFGLETAKKRAIKWSENPNVHLPHSLKKAFLKFKDRCDRYFQDAEYQQGYGFYRINPERSLSRSR
jgi:hypothetical protein